LTKLSVTLFSYTVFQVTFSNNHSENMRNSVASYIYVVWTTHRSEFCS